MLSRKPTAEMIKEWQRIYNEYRDGLSPNQKTGEEVNNYFIEKYSPEIFESDKFKNVVLYNILANEHHREKLNGQSPQILTYKTDDVLVGIDLITAHIHVESKNIDKAAAIYDDLFAYRGLDEKDLINYFLVAQYVELTSLCKTRLSRQSDLKSIMEIYDYARKQMALNDNPTQWIDGYPSQEIILNDIANNNSYIIESKGKICGVFTFIIGVDPTYQNIDGKWLDDAPYGTIHRIASNGIQKGIFIECINFCKSKISNLRIDTHNDNKIMRHLLDKNGFSKCGIIKVGDGTPRIAYQKKF